MCMWADVLASRQLSYHRKSMCRNVLRKSLNSFHVSVLFPIYMLVKKIYPAKCLE
jgi:hypothetical protein